MRFSQFFNDQEIRTLDSSLNANWKMLVFENGQTLIQC